MKELKSSIKRSKNIVSKLLTILSLSRLFRNNYNKDNNNLIFLITIVIFIGAVLANLNTSSVGQFCKFVPIGCESEELIFSSRPIRSDEWLVVTPFFVSQQNGGQELYLDIVGSEQSVSLLTASSFSRWYTIFRPFALGQFILDSERAYSLWNLGNIVFLFLMVFLLLRAWKVPREYAAIIAAGTLFISFIQWWSAHSVISYIMALIVIVHYYILYFSKNFWYNIKFVFILSFVLLMNLNILYPPFLLSLGYLAMLVSFGFYANKANNNVIPLIIYGSTTLLVSAVISGIIISKFFFDFSDAIAAITNSVYPGQRFMLGGDYPLFKLLSGFYDIQLLNDAKPMIGYNQSSAAGFMNFFIFLLPLVIVSEIYRRIKKHSNDWLILSLTIYLSFILIWMLVGFPQWMAKISLMYLVPAQRAEIGLGIGGTLFLIYYVFSYKEHIKLKYMKILISFIFFISVLMMGKYLSEQFPTYISNQYKIVLLSLACTIVFIFAVFRMKRLFTYSFFSLLLLYGLSVHPIRQGLSPLFESDFAKTVQMIESREPGTWVVYDTVGLSPIIYVNGAKTLSGTYLYPQKKFWKELDQQEEFSYAWNRYATVTFSTEKSSEDVFFNLIQQDAFIVNIHPCNSYFDKYKTMYFVRLGPMKYECLSLEEKLENNNGKIYIYKRT